jgi:hypothetical protein
MEITDTRERTAALRRAIEQVSPLNQGTLKPLLLYLQQYCFRQQNFDQQLEQVSKAFSAILFPAAISAGVPGCVAVFYC